MIRLTNLLLELLVAKNIENKTKSQKFKKEKRLYEDNNETNG
jgi:hypothetical protein